jgi:hypothetical protein
MGMTSKKAADLLIGALIVINALEIGLFFAIRNRATLYGSDVSFPVPSGYLWDRTFMVADSAPCYLIRVSADACPYCRLDQRQFTELAHRAQDVQCKTILVAPKTGQIKWRAGEGRTMQLQYVDMKLGRTLYPFLTPQTILLSGEGRIIWAQEGSMDDQALSVALSALGRTR